MCLWHSGMSNSRLQRAPLSALCALCVNKQSSLQSRTFPAQPGSRALTPRFDFTPRPQYAHLPAQSTMGNSTCLCCCRCAAVLRAHVCKVHLVDILEVLRLNVNLHCTSRLAVATLLSKQSACLCHLYLAFLWSTSATHSHSAAGSKQLCCCARKPEFVSLEKGRSSLANSSVAADALGVQQYCMA